MPEIHNSSDAHLARRAVAEARRQVAIEAAQRHYHLAARAERTLYDVTVAAAQHRLDKATEPLEFIGEDYAAGSDAKTDAVLAELAAARAAVDGLPGAPDHRDLRHQLDDGVRAADQAFNTAAANAFNP